ncbi:MAG: monofunctional biosynthetic peptidoglycan transglycosylase [bacterium]
MASTVLNSRMGLRYFLILLTAFIALGAIALAVSMAQILHLAYHNPETTALMRIRVRQAQERSLPYLIHRVWVPLDSMPTELPVATVGAEDDGFWTHHGFDWEGIRMAAEKNMKSGAIRSGASTITQQLAKNLFLSPQRSYSRKIREAVLTVLLERFLDKHRIMELYLNVIEMGPGIFGMEAGAYYHFGKDLDQLTPHEMALLISIIPSPLGYRIDRDYVNRMAMALQRRIGWLPRTPQTDIADSIVTSEMESMRRFTQINDRLLDSLAVIQDTWTFDSIALSDSSIVARPGTDVVFVDTSGTGEGTALVVLDSLATAEQDTALFTE